MVTAVVSDLHLGLPGSVLHSPAARERLFQEIARAERVVILGDLLALRARPAGEVLEMAAPFLDGLRDVRSAIARWCWCQATTTTAWPSRCSNR